MYSDTLGIEFKDYPNKDTPLNSTNLNKLQNDLAFYMDKRFIVTPYFPNDPEFGDVIFYTQYDIDTPWLLRYVTTESFGGVQYNRWAVLFDYHHTLINQVISLPNNVNQWLSTPATIPFYGKYKFTVSFKVSSTPSNFSYYAGIGPEPLGSLRYPVFIGDWWLTSHKEFTYFNWTPSFSTRSVDMWIGGSAGGSTTATNLTYIFEYQPLYIYVQKT
jgi:hypothetical protein